MLNHGILRKDVFSWSVNGKYWMSHEWLFEIIIYSLKIVFGKFHVFVYSFIFLSFLLLFIFYTNKNKFLKNIPYSLLYIISFFVLIANNIQARPHIISFSLLALTIYVLYDLYKNEYSKKLYFLPVVTIIWANVHGGSSNLSYLLCFLFVIGGLFKFKFSKIESYRLSKRQFIKYIVIMFICMMCVCINAHGFRMFIYPYQNMLDTTMLNNITEWQASNLNVSYHYVYYAFLVFIIFTFLFSNNKIEFMDLLLCGFSAYLGLKSIRFWAYIYIIMSFVIFDYVKERKNDKGTFTCIFIISLFFISFTLINYKHIVNVKFNAYLDSDIIDAVRNENPKWLFNMYDYGGDLVYNDLPVFIDGRADLYSKYNYKDYINISKLKGDYVKLIEKYDFDYFLVNKNYSINTYLKYNSSYEVIYKKRDVVLYKKNS